MFVRWVVSVLRWRYWDSLSGVRRASEPVGDVRRICWSGGEAVLGEGEVSIVSGYGVGGVVGVVVRGRRVMFVAMWPPREKVVRWRRKCPCWVLGSISTTY